MENKMAKHELEGLHEFQAKGYTHNYRVEDGQLIDLETKERFTSNEVTIVEEKRYEGMTNPSDMSILYVLETKDGNKGTIVVPYGPASATPEAEFFVDVPKANFKA